MTAYWGKEPEAGMWLDHLSRLAYCLRTHGLVFMVAQSWSISEF